MAETCEYCKRTVDEVCGDGFCRSCHVSCSWDDCVTSTYQARVLIENGRDRYEVLRLYPHAQLDRRSRLGH